MGRSFGLPVAVATLAWLASACGLLLGTGDAITIADAGTAGDAGTADVGTIDADGSSSDGGSAGVLGCPIPPGAVNVWAQYHFDGTLDEHYGLRPMAAHSFDAPAFVPGPGECGQAVQLASSYVKIADDPVWDQLGSIDFWFRMDAWPAELYGLLSREQLGVGEPGQLTVVVSSTGRVMLRIQNGVGMEVALCSADGAVAPGIWAHVGVNVGPSGPVELWVNGAPATATDGVFYELTCGTNAGAEYGILGDWSWFVGAGAHFDDGTGSDIRFPLSGAIDELRFVDDRRSFAAAGP